MNVNSESRYIILISVTVKGDCVWHVDFVILEHCTDATLFVQAFRILLEKDMLPRVGIEKINIVLIGEDRDINKNKNRVRVKCSGAYQSVFRPGATIKEQQQQLKYILIGSVSCKNAKNKVDIL